MRLTCIRRAIGRIPSMRASSPRMWPTNPLSVHCRAQKEAGAIRARPCSKRRVAGRVRRCRLPAVHSTEEKKWPVEVLSYWAGMQTREYKKFKGLKKENLRDNMTNLELVLNMLAETATTELSLKHEPESFDENRKVAREGGSITGGARKNLEKKVGWPVIR